MKPVYHRAVAKNTANNPVARAYAKHELNRSLVEMKIKLYFMNDGQDCAEETEAVAEVLSTLALAGHLDPSIGPDDVDVRVARGGLSAANEMTASNWYERSNTKALDIALEAAEKINKRVKPQFVNAAWHTVQRELKRGKR